MTTAAHGPKVENPYAPDPLLVQTLDRLLTESCSHNAVQLAEATGWAPEIWRGVADMGVPWVGIAEDAGGMGGTWGDALAVLRICGMHACPLPMAETGLLGGWLLASVGAALPDGPVTVVPGLPADTLHLEGSRLAGRAHNVPWASKCSRVIALVDGHVVSFEPSSVSVTARRNLAGEPREILDVDMDVQVAEAPPGVNTETLQLRGAFCRAALMTGAMQRVSELTVGYANDRRQFGKPIATFQAVASQLVRLAAEAELVAMAHETTVAALSRHGGDVREAAFEIAAFKAAAGEGATLVAGRGHQVHGAIGMTQEYELHQLTRRLWSWREEYGSTQFWQMKAGAHAVAAGADQVWELLADGSHT
jgi:acyl-CoA dehydrogenase